MIGVPKTSPYNRACSGRLIEGAGGREAAAAGALGALEEAFDAAEGNARLLCLSLVGDLVYDVSLLLGW